MFAGPIGVYFLTVNNLYNGQFVVTSVDIRHTLILGPGNSTWAGATAAITANVVLIAYVIVAMKDDESEKVEAEEKARKGL